MLKNKRNKRNCRIRWAANMKKMSIVYRIIKEKRKNNILNKKRRNKKKMIISATIYELIISKLFIIFNKIYNSIDLPNNNF